MTHHIGASEPVIFQLEGKEYRLRYTLGALKSLAHDHKIEVMRGGEAMIDAVRDPAKLALILHHGLMTHHPEVTVEWVESHFDSGMLLEIAPVVAQAISGKTATLPNDDRPDRKANGVGLLVGPSDATTLDSPN